MTKQEIIDELEGLSVAHNPSDNKATLKSLLEEAKSNLGDEPENDAPEGQDSEPPEVESSSQEEVDAGELAEAEATELDEEAQVTDDADYYREMTIAKMRMGLSKTQAMEVVKKQRQMDAAQK